MCYSFKERGITMKDLEILNYEQSLLDEMQERYSWAFSRHKYDLDLRDKEKVKEIINASKTLKTLNWDELYNNRNSDTISIETCHKTEDGSYTKATYESLVKLTAWLCKKYGLTEEDLIRHYDITGKNCPKYFVENEDAWDEFKSDVGKAIKRI